MKKKVLSFLLMGVMMISIVACNQENTEVSVPKSSEEEAQGTYSQANQQENESEQSTEKYEDNATENSEETVVYEAALDELVQLLGMQDSETASLLGGGEENWTEDKNFYIGRIYKIKLYDGEYPVFTSCDNDKIVNAVSVWLANGEREVSQEEVEQWVQRLTELVGTEPVYDDISSEAGTRKWKWVSEERIISLMWTGQILSINMNPAVGELH